jgi:Calcineurin-like phosphoesterase superfamily domain
MKLLIISDTHGNWPALRAVLAAERDTDEILCPGDVAASGPGPLWCVTRAIEHVQVKRLIEGNHDWAVAWDEDPHCSPAYRRLALVRRKHSLRVLIEPLRTFLAQLPAQRSLQLDRAPRVARHSVPSGPRFRCMGFNFDNEQRVEEIDRARAFAFLYVGHRHLPGKMRIGKTTQFRGTGKQTFEAFLSGRVASAGLDVLEDSVMCNEADQIIADQIIDRLKNSLSTDGARWRCEINDCSTAQMLCSLHMWLSTALRRSDASTK